MKKILVVEDEYYARKSIVKILQESDLDIQVCGEAANGMKAIELLEEYKDIAWINARRVSSEEKNRVKIRKKSYILQVKIFIKLRPLLC